jgi:hypothetical protein
MCRDRFGGLGQATQRRGIKVIHMRMGQQNNIDVRQLLWQQRGLNQALRPNCAQRGIRTNPAEQYRVR